MNTLLQYICEHSGEDLHSAIVIGAGNGSQLPGWRQLTASQLMLVEAHPRQAEELARRLRGDQGEHLLALAVTADEQPMATLQPLNNLAYSSLNAAIGLLEHYPNLRSGETLQVPACSLGQLLAEQALDEQQPHLLLIAAPGQAMQLLQGTPAAGLQAFTWLLIECSSEPLYQGDAVASDISAWLQGLGYDLVSDDPDAIYPQSQLLFKRNPSAVEHLRLSVEVAELRSQQVHTAQTSQQQIAALQQQVQQRDAALVEQTRLANERQTQIDMLAKESAELSAARDALAEEKAELTKTRDEQTKLASERKAQLEKITAERDQFQKSVVEQKKNFDNAQQQIKALENEASESLQRQQQLEEELTKAEAQIELIKDLLLREPGF